MCPHLAKELNVVDATHSLITDVISITPRVRTYYCWPPRIIEVKHRIYVYGGGGGGTCKLSPFELTCQICKSLSLSLSPSLPLSLCYTCVYLYIYSMKYICKFYLNCRYVK